MTDNQKVIIAVLGAVVGHLLLFLSTGVLIAVSQLLPQPAAAAAPAPPLPEPEEVTVLLSELLEEIDLTPKDQTQQFARTDPDQESAVRPEDAPFHAERNTLASADLPPTPNAEMPLPTVDARDDLPFVEIRNRNLVDGDFKDASAESAPSEPSPVAAPANAALILPPVTPEQSEGDAEEQPKIPSDKRLENRADPADQPKEAPDGKPENPAEAEESPEIPADKLIQPDTENRDPAQLAEAAPTLVDPFAADAPPLSENMVKKDREAAAVRPSEEIGSPAEPEPANPASAMPRLKQYIPSPIPALTQTPPSPPQPASANIPPSPKSPSDTPAFTPETAARKVEGTISNRSDKPALDVEATDLGRYKKQVTQAIERQWHRYREQNASFVTYGSLRVSFRIDSSGAARNLKIVRNDANAVMANFTLRSILDAKIPKMPPAVATQVGRALEFSYNVIIY